MSTPTDIEAIVIQGVGGFITRTPDGVLRVMQLLTPSGRVLNLALDAPEVGSALNKVCMRFVK